MNLREIRLEAKDALRKSSRPAWKDTLIYFAFTGFLVLVINLAYFALDQAMEGSGGGLQAAKLRSTYSMLHSILYTLSTVSSFLSFFLSFGYHFVMLLRVRGRTVGTTDIFQGFRMLLRVLALSILTFVQIILWSFLFVIPGIVAAYRYRLAVFILMDNPQMLPSQALRASCQLTRGHKKDLFLLDLSFLPYYTLLFLASAFTYIDSYNVAVTLYELALPLLSYAQMIGIYSVGIVLIGLVQLWKMAHVSASTARYYDKLVQPELPPL